MLCWDTSKSKGLNKQSPATHRASATLFSRMQGVTPLVVIAILFGFLVPFPASIDGHASTTFVKNDETSLARTVVLPRHAAPRFDVATSGRGCLSKQEYMRRHKSSRRRRSKYGVALEAMIYPSQVGEVSVVEVEGVEGLRQELLKRGATRFARLSRDNVTYEGRVTGGIRPVVQLSEEDFAWFTDADPGAARHVMFDTYVSADPEKGK